MKYLLDSNIIIYYLNGDKGIYDFIEKHKAISAISLITYYEVLNYNFSKEEELLVRDFLDGFEVLSVSKNIINKALENRKIKKIKMADNFILATAQIFGLDIVTRNIKDFSSFYFSEIALTIYYLFHFFCLYKFIQHYIILSVGCFLTKTPSK